MKAPRFSLFQLMIMAVLGATCVVMKIALKMPVKMPGHTAIFWTAVLLTSTALVRKQGAAFITGLFAAVIAAFASPGGSGPVITFISYFATATGVELGLMLPESRMPKLVRFIAAGLFGAWAKFLVKAGVDLMLGMPLAAVVVRRAYSSLTYTIFGIAGALAGYLVVAALERASIDKYLQERR